MLGALTLTSPPPHSPSAFQSRRRRPPPPAAAAVSDASPAVDRSLYDVLRVERDASPVEIKAAYRTLAKLYHPDATARFVMNSSSPPSSASPSPSPPSDGRDFIEIRKAYATLSDPDARAVYDFNLNVSSRRRWSSGGVGGRFYRTRRWETDQCW